MEQIEQKKRLQEAAMEGNTQLLHEILAQNPLILDRLIVGCDFDETPLHAAALRGHIDFTTQLLNLNSELAKVLDSTRSSPLHLASAKGHIDIVKVLVPAAPNMCTAPNKDGLNPLHLAAMNGKVEVMGELLQTSRQAATATVDQGHGETILHLCVKYHQKEALDLLVHTLKDKIQGFINATDDYGNTILHVAVANKQIQTVQHLLTIDKIDVNAKNINGYTALDILAQSRRGVQDWDIQNSLKQAGALKAADNQGEWLAKKRDALMVVASLLATIAFQAGVSPPGGVWQNDSPKGSLHPHRTGEAVAAYTYPESYQFYLRANTISFVASLSTILLLISGLPLKRKNFMRILTTIMCLSITSIAFSYAFSLVAVTPKTHRVSLRRTLYVAVPVWCVVMVILLLAHTIQLTLRWLKDKNWKSAVENCQIKLGVKDANSNRDVQMT
ncbi:hypothetical protein CsSME_00048662 [Camellia sinensis var. sinensis]|uniref:PGG domain-containing protein n=1 Tax=Camellia sinensis var. sinensis TaxID=542762 RepID=A0A4S4EM73_CAMSN|nr:ankyrin repeat-containing protein BDA1-like [Camellia sinensis]THG17740.1 hypothetical protein TEA_030156 [Camellia sinensis var. sinensis]